MKRIAGALQHYAWGSVDAIPTALGAQPTGEPIAEYWLGAHAKAPSTLVDTSTDLVQELGEHPDQLGSRDRERFGDRLPFLVKLLAADQALSLQAHPTRDQAEAGHADEERRQVPLDAPERTFKDSWPKPEMVVAITPFSTLLGFREPHRTAELFDALGLTQALESVIGPLTQRHGPAALAEVFLDVLSLDNDRLDLANQTVAAAVQHQHDEGEVGRFARTAVELDAHFPTDRGILGALMLNRLDLQPGQAAVVPPGMLHAHLLGLCLEVQANSDNVLRGGLTSKHIDVDALVQVLSFEPYDPPVLEGDQVAPGLLAYPTGQPEFSLWKVVPSADADTIELPAEDSARVLLVLEGHLEASTGDTTIELVKGESVFIAAGESVRVSGDADAFLAASGRDD